MRTVEPRVYLIAATQMDIDAVVAWLESLGGLKVLDTMTGGDPEQLIELAARRCYKSFDVGLNPNVTRIRTDSSEYHANILAQRHGSVLAHAHVTFAFEDVSRVFTHEVVRNSTGNDLSQESLRYVRLTDIPFWLPPEIAEDPWALGKFREWIAAMESWQRELAEHYQIDSMKDFNRKKKLTSVFRRVAPMGLPTGIVVTFNIRSLRWIIEQRTSRHAEHEIRMVFDQVAVIACAEWPYLFQDFTAVVVDGVREWTPQYSKV